MDIELTEELRAAIFAHAEREQPRECCGLLVRSHEGWLGYMAGKNLLDEPGVDRFRLDPETWVAAESCGQVVAVVHSHPNASANPSMADRVMCERTGLPWVIMGWPSGVVKQLQPEGWQAPYVGREFTHGVLDCYTLIQDWYFRELGMELLDFDREDEWWAKGQDLYMQNFEKAGFVQVAGQPQRHDVILMQVASRAANHGAIYKGSGVILHHLYGRPSCEDVWGGYWERHAIALLRHKSFAGAQASDLAGDWKAAA